MNHESNPQDMEASSSKIVTIPTWQRPIITRIDIKQTMGTIKGSGSLLLAVDGMDR